jgi:predicted nucleic acid-binding protein
LNVVDSSAFLEYLLDSPASEVFAPVIEDTAQLVVPAIVIYEVTRRLRTVAGEAQADHAWTELTRARVAPLDADLAYAAALLGTQHQLAMADALIYATARQHGATLWTQDAHFKDLPGVRYFPKIAA